MSTMAGDDTLKAIAHEITIVSASDKYGLIAKAYLEQRETTARLERERDEARERVRVLEALVKTAAALIAAHESEEIGAEFKVASAAYEEARALAGTEALYDDEHAASCDVNTSPHDYGWEKVTTCTCGADGGERRD